MQWVTVDDFYHDVKGTNVKLLSEYSNDFWLEYVSKHTYYDRLFNRMFSCFRFFDQSPSASHPSAQEIHDLRVDFTDAVYDLLMVNDKRFSELYRVNVIDDSKYSIFNNYDIVETKEEERASSGTDNIGQKTDTDTNVYGSAVDSNTRVEGQRTDTSNETKGSRTDTASDTIGSRNDSEENVIGAKTDTDNVTQGAQNNSREAGIAGFNSNDYSDDTLVNESLGARSDSASHTQGQQTNTRSASQGQQSNSHSATQGQQANSMSNVKGEMTVTDTKNIGGRSDTLTHLHSAQENTYEHGDNVSYTLTRKGNIGVRTVTEILEQHKDMWSLWEFYSYIFKEICAELLLI